MDPTRFRKRNRNKQSHTMKTIVRFVRSASAAFLLAGAFGAGIAQAQHGEHGVAQAQQTGKKPRPYPLDTCLVSGEKLGQGGMKPYAFTYKDREIQLCCKDCLKDFQKDPAKFIQKLEAAAKPYPLDTCLVSGEKLWHGNEKPYAFAYQGREIQLCCKDCLKDFQKEPAKFIQKLEAAEKTAREKKATAGHHTH